MGTLARILVVCYYSFITLATVGYGDVTPTTPLARTLALIDIPVCQIRRVVSGRQECLPHRGEKRSLARSASEGNLLALPRWRFGLVCGGEKCGFQGRSVFGFVAFRSAKEPPLSRSERRQKLAATSQSEQMIGSDAGSPCSRVASSPT